MALSRVGSEIFNVEKYRDLEIAVRRQSRSLKVVPFDRLDMVSYLRSIVTLSLRCTVLRYSTSKVPWPWPYGLEVRQCHWKCHRSIERIWLPI